MEAEPQGDGCRACGGDRLCPDCGDLRELWLRAMRPDKMGESVFAAIEAGSAKRKFAGQPVLVDTAVGPCGPRERETHRLLAAEIAPRRALGHATTSGLTAMARLIERGDGPLAAGLEPTRLSAAQAWARGVYFESVSRDAKGTKTALNQIKAGIIDFLTPEARAEVDESRLRNAGAKLEGIVAVEAHLRRLVSVPAPIEDADGEPNRRLEDLRRMRESARPGCQLGEDEARRERDRRTKLIDLTERAMGALLSDLAELDLSAAQRDPFRLLMEEYLPTTTREGR